MKTARKISILGLAVPLFFLLGPSESFPLSSVESLKGLQGVEVLVEELNPDLENFNLSVIQIQSLVESKLRKWGVKVLSKEENEKIQPLRRPYLYIRINSNRLSPRKEPVAFNIGMALNQQIVLRGYPDSKSKCFYAPTWYMSSVGAAGRKNISELLDAVEDLAEKFIHAYLTVNPKE